MKNCYAENKSHTSHSLLAQQALYIRISAMLVIVGGVLFAALAPLIHVLMPILVIAGMSLGVPFVLSAQAKRRRLVEYVKERQYSACSRCGYDPGGIPTGKCPECGCSMTADERCNQWNQMFRRWGVR